MGDQVSGPEIKAHETYATEIAHAAVASPRPVRPSAPAPEASATLVG